MKRIKTLSPQTITKAIHIQAIIVILVALSVISGWIFHIRWVLHIVPESPTMKFNTALCFLLSGIGLFCVLKDDEKPYRLITFSLGLGIFLLGTLSFFEYFFNIYFNIDTLFVDDPYSTVLPGRMSLATALCFSFFGVSLLAANSKNMVFKKTGQHIALFILLIAMVGVFTFVFNTANKTYFFDTMAIHTAILFHLLAESVSLKNASYGFTGFYLGRMNGSRLIRWMLPFIITTPLVLGYILLQLLSEDLLEENYAITYYTLFLTLISVIYIAYVAIQLNKTHFEQIKLEKSLMAINLEMEQYEYALDASSIVAITDRKGIITYANNKFCEISKYSRKELIGQKLTIVDSGYHSKEFFEDIRHEVSNGDVWIGGIKNKAKDGSLYWTHTVIVPFKDENGKIYQHLYIRQDITKLRMLSSQYENLKLKNKEIEQFTYIASHDLQEPLRTVTGMVEIIQEKYKDQFDEEANTCINYTLEATTRMSYLIKGLLDYSRIGGDKQLETANLNAIVDAIKKDLFALIKETKAVITCDNLPKLKVYPTELRLVFQNLIANAIKFQKQGNISKIHIMAEKQGEDWKLSVQDNGIGISNINHKKIFGIFQRLNNRSDYEGTGIGLAHCEKIVHLHGGSIWVDSKPNEGSTFYFTISTNLK
jgi:PAS domain S-box-containing protein